MFLTEFGRTPKINSNGGRDHWGKTGSIFFAGAGVKAGQVIGASDKNGAFPTTPRMGLATSRRPSTRHSASISA